MEGARLQGIHFTVFAINVGYTVPVTATVMEIAHETRCLNKIDDCEIVNDNGKAQATQSIQMQQRP